MSVTDETSQGEMSPLKLEAPTNMARMSVTRDGVPSIEVMVEGGGAAEHAMHVGDRGDVPAGDVAVEGGGVAEHAFHVGD